TSYSSWLALKSATSCWTVSPNCPPKEYQKSICTLALAVPAPKTKRESTSRTTSCLAFLTTESSLLVDSFAVKSNYPPSSVPEVQLPGVDQFYNAGIC